MDANQQCCLSQTPTIIYNGDVYDCPSQYQNANATGCQTLFNNDCIDIPDKSDSGYYNAWNSTRFCSDMVTKITRNVNGSLNLDGVNYIRPEMYTLFENYFTTSNGTLQYKTTPPNTFQTTLQQTCLNNPYACNFGLQSMCAGYTRDDIKNIPGLLQMCGCYLLDKEYTLYENLYGLPRFCDSICNRTDTIRNSLSDGSIQLCNSTVCIIDDINISIVDSTSGSVNLNQACSGCNGNTSCTCLINNSSISAVNSNIGDINISNVCSGNTICYTTNPTDPTLPAIQAPCNTSVYGTPESETSSTSGTTEETSTNYFIPITILIVFLLIVFIMGISLYYSSQSEKVVRININDIQKS